MFYDILLSVVRGMSLLHNTDKMKTVAIWISKHDINEAQREELQEKYNVDKIIEKKNIGEMNLNTENDVLNWMEALLSVVKKYKEDKIILVGVWTTPILPYMFNLSKNTTVLSAWNVMCSIEEEKPTFRHKKFINIGKI